MLSKQKIKEEISKRQKEIAKLQEQLDKNNYIDLIKELKGSKWKLGFDYTYNDRGTAWLISLEQPKLEKLVNNCIHLTKDIILDIGMEWKHYLVSRNQKDIKSQINVLLKFAKENDYIIDCSEMHTQISKQIEVRQGLLNAIQKWIVKYD